MYAGVKDTLMVGLHVPAFLSFLTFGGTCARKSSCGIRLDDRIEIHYTKEVKESLLELRTTFASLLSAYFEGRSDVLIAQHQFKHLLSYNEGGVDCNIVRRRVPALWTPDAEPPVQFNATPSEAHASAQALCSLLPAIDTLQCLKNGLHQPSKKRKGRAAYELFQAASDGCLKCVRRELEVTMRVSPDVVSDNECWSVRDCATYALANGVETAAEVKDYLDEYWGHLPLRQCIASLVRTSRSSTPRSSTPR